MEPTRRPSILDFLAIAASLPNWPGTNVPLPAAPRGVGGGAGGGAGGHADAYSEAGPAHTAVDSTGGDGAEEEEGGDGWSTYQHTCQHTYRRRACQFELFVALKVTLHRPSKIRTWGDATFEAFGVHSYRSIPRGG